MNTYLRNVEYYNMQSTLDRLYDESKMGKQFNRLYNLIVSRKNILLAYRTIKTNTGSKTYGTDGITINDFKTMEEVKVVRMVRNALRNYKPRSVKRVLIPKANGKDRLLGIPTMLDRLIQQCFKQVLEPIMEAKFFKHSYGFRPLRSCTHALARIQSLINSSGYHYVVDIDIKGFFDNINHKHLMNQLWNMGIRDLKVRAIIRKMLKAPIKGEGIPTKGTPQGGILSPLLANVVLNDFDHWIASQWEEFKTHTTYSPINNKYRALYDSGLKRGFLVRYADDFKIMARDWKSAWKWYYAAKQYLKQRLKLDISQDKSKVINLRKLRSEFLGFEIKAIPKKNKYVARTYVSEKSLQKIKRRLKRQIIRVQKMPTRHTADFLNSLILGVHSYYRYATFASHNFSRISFDLTEIDVQSS